MTTTHSNNPIPECVFVLISGEHYSATDLEGRKLVSLDPHGARHRAAINFAYLNPGGVAFVVSEDGPAKVALRIRNRVIVWPVRISET